MTKKQKQKIIMEIKNLEKCIIEFVGRMTQILC